jgi:hypothetical protein
MERRITPGLTLAPGNHSLTRCDVFTYGVASDHRFCLSRIVRRLLSGRSPAADGRGKSLGDDAGGGGSEKNSPVKNRLNDRGRSCDLCRGVLKAGYADRAIVVLASVIVMMEGHSED